MPVDPKARVRISAFNWVPPFAQGYVRDLRVRWALEEAGVPYAVRKLDFAAGHPADYFEEQPFGQVPSYRDGKELIEQHRNLVAYKVRCQARPAFKAALAAQLDDFECREAVPA